MNDRVRKARALVAGTLLAVAMPSFAAGDLSEVDAKAAAITNFLLFARWPGSSNANVPLRLCVLRDGSMGGALDRYAGLKIHGRSLEVRRLGRELGDLPRCAAVFIEGDNPHELPRIVAETRGEPILILATGERALQGGAMIALSFVANRLVFDINLSSIRESGLDLSAKLLRLARTVSE